MLKMHPSEFLSTWAHFQHFVYTGNVQSFPTAIILFFYSSSPLEAITFLYQSKESFLYLLPEPSPPST